MGLFGNSKNKVQPGELDNIITLKDEQGRDCLFEFLDLIRYSNRKFVVLLPNNNQADQVVILEVEESNGDEDSYVSIDSAEELEILYALFKHKFKDEFNFLG